MKVMVPVLLLTLVNTLGFSILIPVLPFVLREWQMPDWSFGFTLAIYSLCQFWAAPIFGQLSDQFGRRPLLIWSQAGTLLSWILFIALWYADSSLQFAGFELALWLAAVRIIDGVTGGNNSVTSAYLADITSKEHRAVAFGYVSAVIGLGMIIGPAIGAYTMATPWGYLTTAVFGTALSTVTLLCIIYSLPEPLNTFASPTPINWLKPFMLRAAFIALRGQTIVKNVLVVKMFLSATMGAYTSIMVFYLIDHFQLSEAGIGNFLFFVGAFAIFNQTVMIKPIVHYFGEPKALAFGIILLILGLITFPLITHLWVLVGAYYLCNLGFSISIPTIKGVISNQTPAASQGKILGFEESLNSLMFALMPIIATGIYGYLNVNSFYIWTALALLGLVYLLCVCSAILKDATYQNKI